MKNNKMELKATGYFSSLFLKYIEKDPEVKSFYHLYPEIENFKKSLEERKFSASTRLLLQNVLKEQYQGIPQNEKLTANIEALGEENTFTITTGHQLNIFTGPLYFIYKLATVVLLSKKLKEKYPAKNFIPVYWMASEDHDFEEINHFYLFNKKFVWETDQKGAVGRFSTSGMEQILSQAPDIPDLFHKAYKESKNLADATRYIVNELFGEEGLVVVDADDKTLKTVFKPVIIDELKNQTAFGIISESSKKLEGKGYGIQAPPRLLNLFYLIDGIRERIDLENGKYKINNTDLTFSTEEIIQLAEEHPEIFSPNVMLRPLYQEMVLPNLAYIGGPAEIAYWLQLKGLFNYYEIDFPILTPRIFAMVINKINSGKMEKLGIGLEDIFMDAKELKDKFLLNHNFVEFSVDTEKRELEKVFEKLKSEAMTTDKSLEKYILAEKQKSMKILEDIEKKINAAEKRKFESGTDQIIKLKEKLFPGNGLQERHDNFLNFFINDPDFIQKVYQASDPLDFKFNILQEDE